MYVITAHQRYRQTDGRTDVKRSHDRYIAKACSGKKWHEIERKHAESLICHAETFTHSACAKVDNSQMYTEWPKI